MANGFTYDLATDIGKVRRNLRDTNETTAAFSDAEIQSFLDTEGSVNAATAAAIRVLHVAGGRFSRIYSKGDESEDQTAGLAELREAITIFGSNPTGLPKGGTFSIARHPTDPCSVS